MYSTLMQWNNYWRSRWLAASSGIYCIASGPVASRHEALVATSGVPAMAADTLGMARIEETDWKKPLLRCLQVPCDKACLHSSSACVSDMPDLVMSCLYFLKRCLQPSQSGDNPSTPPLMGLDGAAPMPVRFEGSRTPWSHPHLTATAAPADAAVIADGIRTRVAAAGAAEGAQYDLAAAAAPERASGSNV
eukprot:CAMPEP_0206150658 /NCGR_PEP_ID=MMETSP1473-20131121/38414_1 /ASSEMBLY_ACC=CAM_ASM_001109 /TAXON_ID=1461547 /ORGANISM="Stichococcus sp, Strain RCC1054" /LENGTH=190 /DNA_ID=CAMNT_0053548169 /DNA_START=1516 /DNA_END=2090 /DNA_ORIENTATION=-